MHPQITDKQVAFFRSLFRGREDVYALHWHDTRTGKSGYKPMRNGQEETPVFTDAAIRSHLEGKQLLGIYPLLTNNKTYFLAIDFDKEEWLQEACAVIEAAKSHELTCYLERSKSGNGGHLWFFFEQSLPAWKARQIGKVLLHETGISRAGSFDRMFPSQEIHSGKGLGNLIALPLNGKHLMEGNTAFISLQRKPHSDQWRFLEQCIRNPTNLIDYIINRTTFQVEDKKDVKSATITKTLSEIRISDALSANILLDHSIFLPSLTLSNDLYKFLRKKLIFQNPEYAEKQRRGFSTWRTLRWIYALQREEEGIRVPLGFLDALLAHADEHGIQLYVDDKRATCKPISFKTTIVLNTEQKKVVTNVLKKDRAIMEAVPGFGKTMVALCCIKRRKQPTLIIVHTKTLLQQWKKRIEEWFDLNKGDLGIIGDGKWSIGKKVTIASYKTLLSRGMNDIQESFGFVIVDECHHVPARTFTEVINSLPAKYVLGLTATAYRKDKLHMLLPLYIGPIIKVEHVPKQSSDTSIRTLLRVRQTAFTTRQKGEIDFHALINDLTGDIDRNRAIVRDIVLALHAGGKCLVLTERVDHCQVLLDLVRKETKGVHAGIAEGRMTKKARERLSQRIKQDQFQLLIATGKLIGEGFDWPECTHLFLVCPFSFKGMLVQYVGRVQRETEGKEAAFVFDYADMEVPMLKAMYFKRLRTYRAMGLVRERGSKRSEKASDDQMAMF